MMQMLLNPEAPAFIRDPYCFYRALQLEKPFLKTAPGFYVLTQEREVRAILNDKRFGRDFQGVTRRAGGRGAQSLPPRAGHQQHAPPDAGPGSARSAEPPVPQEPRASRADKTAGLSLSVKGRLISDVGSNGFVHEACHQS